MSARRQRPNFTYAMFSMAMSLFLLGYLALSVMHLEALVRLSIESTLFTVELHDDATGPEIEALKAKLAASPLAKPNTIAYVSKEDAAQSMKEDLGDFTEDLGFNPLSNSVQFNLRAESAENSDLSALVSAIEQLPYVKMVYYDKTEFGDARRNIRRLTLVLLGLSLLFGAVSVMLMDGAVRLMLFADRFLIRNMQLVGATQGFILKPYLRRGLFSGLISAGLAIAGILGLSLILSRTAPEIAALTRWWMLPLTALCILVLGAGISVLSTWVGVRKYLKMKVDQLY